MANEAIGSPTKEFFVGMLTRDIELSDAILDLLDNCLDGVVRQKGTFDKRTNSKYYAGYFSHIVISNTAFTLEDNCGGIPRDIAEKYAFRMGRSIEKGEADLPTVGIYGIGMKRAIFKMGRTAEVKTRNNNQLYCVSIPREWETTDDWNFPIVELNDPNMLQNGGTMVSITELNQGISDVWETPDKIDLYIQSLIKAIQQSYSFILQKGFEITINSQPIEALPIQLLVSDEESEGIKPFLFKQTFDDVQVSLAVGFYAPPPSAEDIDDENELKRSTGDAGWTIVCNDRVVLYNDKSHLTGWGEAGVPQYHTQFIGIRGIVIFESNNPESLPMTTTKRGVDTSSKIYAVVKDRMRQGLKMFTDYTNRWKGQSELERTHSLAAKSVSIDSLVSNDSSESQSYSNQYSSSKGGLVAIPDLPKPPSDKPYKIVRFSRSTDDIDELIEFFYNDSTHNATPSHIGERCFDFVLTEARKGRG